MSAGVVVVRPRQPGDVDACVALLRTTHLADGYPVRAASVSARWLTTPADAPAWVALVADVVVGHVAVVADQASRTAEVSRLFTDPAARGTGAGRRLLDVAVDRAEADGHRVLLEVVAGTGAADFYARRGWTPTGRHTAGWADDAGAHPTLLGFALPAPRPRDDAGRLARARVLTDRMTGVLLDQDAPNFLPAVRAVRDATTSPGRPRQVLRAAADVHAQVMVGGLGSIDDLVFWPPDARERVSVNERWQALRAELAGLLGAVVRVETADDGLPILRAPAATQAMIDDDVRRLIDEGREGQRD